MPGTEANQNQVEPLTYEQLFGVPEPEVETLETPPDFCPYLKIKCPAWDGDCQLDTCVMNGADDGASV